MIASYSVCWCPVLSVVVYPTCIRYGGGLLSHLAKPPKEMTGPSAGEAV